MHDIFNVKPGPEAERLAAKYGYLPYMVERYFEIFGSRSETVRFLEACEKPLRRSIRCNTLRIDCGSLRRRLEARGFSLKPIPWAPHGFWVLDGEAPLGATPEYLLGYYYIQGPASMLPAYSLSPSPSDLVVDMAAAPGGKTTQIAQLMGNRGAILAVDVSRPRIRALRANLGRMGVTNTVVVRMDARRLVLLKDRFSRILLDAPCTGEGLIPLDPSRKTSKTLEDLRRASELQAELLWTAAEIAVPGGVIVYATCSIAPEENEYVVARVLERRSDLEIIDAGIPVGLPGLSEYRGMVFEEADKCRRLYPHIHGTEGFFLCRLVKRD